jgi:hypothetical protein
MDDEAEKEKLIKQIQEGAAFAGGFIPALLKMRKAELEGAGVALTAPEVKATMDAFRLMRHQ